MRLKLARGIAIVAFALAAGEAWVGNPWRGLAMLLLGTGALLIAEAGRTTHGR